MRTIHFPLLAYSLSLLSVAAGQLGQIPGDAVGSLPPFPTSTEVPTTTTEDPTSSTSPTSTSSSTDETSTTHPSTESESPTTSRTETTPTDVPSTSPSPPGESSTPPSTTTAPETHKTTVHVVTTIHGGGGTPVVKTLTVTSAEPQTTSDSGPTSAPGLSQTSSDGDSSGLSDDEKKIVIGVVVGVGGAILIGGIMVVFWRISSRRKAAQNDESADLMSGTAVGTGAREKTPSPGAGGPFRSTLDQYHNPGPVNAASNF